MFQSFPDSILRSVVHSKEVHRDAGLKLTAERQRGFFQPFGLFQHLGGAQCKHDCKNTCLKMIPFSAQAAKLCLMLLSLPRDGDCFGEEIRLL